MKRRGPKVFPSLTVRLISALLLFSSAVGVRGQITYTWSGGDMVTGLIVPTSIAANLLGLSSTLNIVNGTVHDVGTLSFTNNGTVNWTGSGSTIRGGGSITNNLAWNDSATGLLTQDFGAWAFVNSAAATYTKTAGTTDFGASFNNSGTILVSGGTLNLANGGNFFNGSVVGSTGSGIVQLTGGILNASGTITATNFIFNGGNFTGNQTFAATSSVTWQSGTWSSGNTTTFANGSTLNLTGANDHDLPNHTLINNGTTNWSGAGRIRIGGSGGVINNKIWNDTATSQINADYGFGASFTNSGGAIYNKVSGVTDFTVPFLNAGTINVTGGVLNLTAGGTFSDNSAVGSSGSGVVQLTGGTLTMNGAITATNFIFNGGTLAGIHAFNNSTVFWQDGVWGSSSTTILAAGSILSILTAHDHDLPGHFFINNSTVNWSGTGTRIRSGNGGSVTNNGTWNDSATGDVNADYGGAFNFTNASGGNYNKTAGTTTFSVPLLNDGTVSVSGGTLSLIAGGTFGNGSTFGSSGSGVAKLTSGLLTANGTVNVPNFILAGGQVTGTQTFNGVFSWQGSNFNTAGTMTVGATSTLNIATSSDHDYDGHALINNGVVNWTAGRLRSGSGGTFTNNAAFNDSNAAGEVNSDYGSTLAQFINSATGTYTKTAGSTTFLGGTFVNSGIFSVTGGTVNLDSGTLNSGSKIGSTGSGTVQLNSGILAANGTIQTQNFLLNGGLITGTQTFSGTLNWIGANFNTGGTTTIGAGSTLTISTTADHDYDSHAFVNNGTVNWTDGRLRSGTGGTITNNGQWNDSAPSRELNSDYGSTAASFINTSTGVYTKSAAGTTTFSIPLTNAGLLKVSAGLLSIQAGFNTTNGSIMLAGGALTSASAVTMGSGTLSGIGTITAPSISSTGVVLPGLAGAAGQLTVNSNLSLLSASQSLFELGGTTQGTQYDFISVSGNLALGGNLAVTFIGGFNTTVTSGNTFTLISSSSLSGGFLNVANGTRINTSDGFGSFVVNYGAGSPFAFNTVVLSNYLAVPEPSTWALLATGCAFLAFAARRKKSK